MKLKIGIYIIIIIPILAAFYFGLQLPISYDEAYTFINFTNKGFWHTLTHYPAPNNHVLHSLITIFFYKIPGIKPILALRIPSWLYFISSVICSYYLIKKIYNIKVALLFNAIHFVLFFSLYYSYMSRGYGLILLCFIICFYHYQQILKFNLVKNWIYFTLFSIIGFCTIPTFLFPFASFIILIIWNKLWKNTLIFGTLISLFSFLFYLPIIINDGLNKITNNTYVQSHTFLETFKQLPLFLYSTFNTTFGILTSLVIIFIIIILRNYLKDKNYKEVFQFLTFFIIPIVIMLFQRIIPFERTFNYFGFILLLFIIIGFNQFIVKIRMKFIIPTLIIFQFIMLSYFNNKVIKYEERDLALNITADKVIPKLMGNYTYCSYNTLLQTNLEFHLLSNEFKKYKIEEHYYLTEVSADSITQFDYIFIAKDIDKTKKKNIKYSTEYYNIY